MDDSEVKTKAKTYDELEWEVYFLGKQLEWLESHGRYFVYEDNMIRPMTKEEIEDIEDVRYFYYWNERSKAFGHDLFDCIRYQTTFPTFYWCMMESVKRYYGLTGNYARKHLQSPVSPVIRPYCQK